MQYRILTDYGSYEGMKFQDGVFDTVDEAVRSAMDINSAFKFLIVSVIDWEAKEKLT